jgi:O-antigen/teichoic acid export membrane protein
MSLKKTAMSGMVWTFTQQFGSQGITFVVSLVMARILEPAEFGLIGMISVFMALATSLVDSGMTQSLIRKSKPDQEDFSTVFFFNLGMSIFIYLLLFFCSPLIADFYDQPILTPIVRVYCLSFIINSFSAVQLTRLTKEMNFKMQMMVALPSILVSGLLGIALAYLDYGVWSLVWMGVFQSLFSSIQLWIRSGWAPSFVFNRAKFKEHFSFGYNLAISGILNTVFQNIYQIVIGRFFSPAQVGFFTRANALKQLPVVNISNTLNKVTYPLFASINNDDVRLKRVYRQIMQTVIFCLSPVLVFMGVVAEPLFRFLFTEKWLPAVPYFQVLCITGILFPIHSYNLSILKIKGRSDLFLRLEILKKVIISISIIISIRFGIMGLIWSQVVTNFIAFFINSYYTGKYINYPALSQLKDIMPAIILSFAVGMGIYALDYFALVTTADIVRITLGPALGLALYLAFSWLLKFDSYNDIKNILLRR